MFLHAVLILTIVFVDQFLAYTSIVTNLFYVFSAENNENMFVRVAKQNIQ